MEFDKINNLINEIQKVRQSKLLVYITGDRRKRETKIGMDVFPLINEHLSELKNLEKLDLLIYSTGGITMAGFGLVNLFREYCEEFNVIIPFKAYSCATLICLGANEIIMSKLGQLSPIDPSLPHPLGPTLPGTPQNIPISVEDVSAYIDLAKESGLESEVSLKLAFDNLSQRVHPLALGAVHRTKEQNEFLADYLLSYHINDQQKREHIIKILTKERFSHNYLIGRNEAKNILKLNIVDPSPEIENLIMDLFKEYNQMFSLNEDFSEEVFLGRDDRKQGLFNMAIIQSENLTHVFQTESIIERQTIQHPQIPIPRIIYPEIILKQGWVKL